MSGLLTNSGRLVSRDAGHPSLMDIAIGISRQPRFGGQTGRWWSVIDHSLFCDELVQAKFGSLRVNIAELRLAVLLHDAHEALTGDVPTPLKTEDFRGMQDALDARIYGAFGPEPVPAFTVKDTDVRALRAEASLFLPHPAVKIAELFGEPDAADIWTLNEYLQESYAGVPPLKRDQQQHPAVREYLNRVMDLL